MECQEEGLTTSETACRKGQKSCTLRKASLGWFTQIPGHGQIPGHLIFLFEDLIMTFIYEPEYCVWMCVCEYRCQ